MTNTAALDRVAAAIRNASGIVVHPHQYDALEAAIVRAHGDPVGDLTELVQTGSDLLDRVVDEVAVKETTFLRDRAQLDAIDWHEQYRIACETGDGVVRVWSAGCATGEEAYSLAMLACEAFADRTPPVRITGTDLSPSALAAARHGQYRERALREVDPPSRDRYFVADGDGYLVRDELRELLTFVRHNLVTDPTPFAHRERPTVVLCRNVFIYFEAATVDRVLDAMRSDLPEGGVVIVGAADALAGTYAASNPEVVHGGKAAGVRGRARLGARWDRSRTTRTVDGAADRRARLDPRIIDAIRSARIGSCDEALALADQLLDENALDADALFLRGIVALERDDATGAIRSLRAAVYADPTFSVAAFMLGQAHEAAGSSSDARRAYEQSLRTADRNDRRQSLFLEPIGVEDIIAACQRRLASVG